MGAPGRNRTCDNPLRRRVLYPTELQAHEEIGDSNGTANSQLPTYIITCRVTIERVIVSFADRDTHSLSQGIRIKRFISIEEVARRKLRLLEISQSLEDLKVPPGNRLEKLKGRRAGQMSIRINDRWRICFRWTSAGAAEVEIVDYH